MGAKPPFKFTLKECLQYMKNKHPYKLIPIKDEDIPKIQETGTKVMFWLFKYYKEYYSDEEFNALKNLEYYEHDLGTMNAATLYNKDIHAYGIGINTNMYLAVPYMKGLHIYMRPCNLEEAMGFSLSHEFTHILENERLKKKYHFTDIHKFINSLERRHESENAAVESEIMYLVENHNLKLTDAQIDWYIDISTDFQTYTGDKDLAKS